MRIGQNPEKREYKELEHRQHRIIIPVYIPDDKQEYFDKLFEILKTSLNALFKTINHENTAITIINNACKKEVTAYLDQLLVENKINKHVRLDRNYGKVYTVIAEAKSSYEELITIADADVFYFSDWENEVIKIFNAYPKAGVVAPLPGPHLTFYHNISLWVNNFFSIKKGNILTKESFTLFEEGIGNDKIFLTKKKNWKKNQFYLEKKGVKACVGAGHFIATYRKKVIQNLPLEKPKYIFKDGDEEFFLDRPIDYLGYYRLATVNTYAYHLGNMIPEWVHNYKHQNIPITIKINLEDTTKKSTPRFFILKRIVVSLFRKFIKH